MKTTVSWRPRTDEHFWWRVKLWPMPWPTSGSHRRTQSCWGENNLSLRSQGLFYMELESNFGLGPAPSFWLKKMLHNLTTQPLNLKTYKLLTLTNLTSGVVVVSKLMPICRVNVSMAWVRFPSNPKGITGQIKTPRLWLYIQMWPILCDPHGFQFSKNIHYICHLF